MKRYLLFTFDQYELSETYGGWCDFDSDFDLLSKAYAKLQKIQNNEGNQYFHIVDTCIGKIVMHSGNHYIPKNLILNGK